MFKTILSGVFTAMEFLGPVLLLVLWRKEKRPAGGPSA
jgi:hypothetical protein